MVVAERKIATQIFRALQNFVHGVNYGKVVSVYTTVMLQALATSGKALGLTPLLLRSVPKKMTCLWWVKVRVWAHFGKHLENSCVEEELTKKNYQKYLLKTRSNFYRQCVSNPKKLPVKVDLSKGDFPKVKCLHVTCFYGKYAFEWSRSQCLNKVTICRHSVRRARDKEDRILLPALRHALSFPCYFQKPVAGGRCCNSSAKQHWRSWCATNTGLKDFTTLYFQ